MFLGWRKKSYTGTHVCITGGSNGLGFALAKVFIEENANLSIIARTSSKLERARKFLTECAEQKARSSKIVAVVGDCSNFDSIQKAIRKAEKELGAIDVLVANAGTAAPGRFLDTDISDFESQMKTNYLGTVYTVKSVVEEMVEREKGEIVLISSSLGVIGLTGYSAYAPTKWALRGFADCLRMEMQAYNVSVRIAYPPNMQTPGYAEELKRTPHEVKDILDASGDSLFEPAEVARAILRGMKQNKYHLPSPDTLQTLSQTAMAGLSPIPNFLLFQAFINFICTFLFAYFVRTFDCITTKHAKKRRPEM